MADLKGLHIAILATDGFEQSELADPKKALENAGAKTSIVSLKSGKIKGWKDKNWGDEFNVDEVVDKAQAENYDGLLLPGGVISPDKLRANVQAVDFVKDFFKQDKLVAAICHGPWTLINAEGVKGKTLTSYESIKLDLTNAGAKWVDKEVVTDGKLITSRKPADIPAFTNAVIEMLSQR